MYIEVTAIYLGGLKEKIPDDCQMHTVDELLDMLEWHTRQDLEHVQKFRGARDVA